jgi:hypothetical protein
MRIEKWYLDCVTPDGAGMIGYAARPGWGLLALRISETLQWGATDSVPLSRTVVGGPLPVATATAIDWQSRAVATTGRWVPLGPGIAPVVLHEESAGRIEWTCRCPAARASVRIGATPYEGLGYAEQLVLTLPFARLPFRELRWGRFVTEAHHCVWIRWRGRVERSWCFHNARLVDANLTNAHELTWHGHRLQLARGMTLRSGRVADTIAADAGWWRGLIPASLGKVEETKWCSRGVLTDAQGRGHTGWAIHEVANFP